MISKEASRLAEGLKREEDFLSLACRAVGPNSFSRSVVVVLQSASRNASIRSAESRTVSPVLGVSVRAQVMCFSALGRISIQCLANCQTKPINAIFLRTISNNQSSFRNRSVVYYTTSVVFLVGGLSYAAVPLYRIYCQASANDAENVQKRLCFYFSIYAVRVDSDALLYYYASITVRFHSPPVLEDKLALFKAMLKTSAKK